MSHCTSLAAPEAHQSSNVVCDPVDLKHRFVCNLMSQDEELRNSIVLYMVYTTLSKHDKLTVDAVKSLLCSEYFVSEAAIDGAIAGLVARSMFASATRFRAPGAPVGSTYVSVRKPPTEHFAEWLRRIEAQMPELSVFEAPIYGKKTK